MLDIPSCLSCGGLVVSITLVGCDVILSLLRPFTARSFGSKSWTFKSRAAFSIGAYLNVYTPVRPLFSSMFYASAPLPYLYCGVAYQSKLTLLVDVDVCGLEYPHCRFLVRLSLLLSPQPSPSSSIIYL
ncbi:hypothetical protein HZ326_5300 [Fusarium oxysporum f. sp. albedinis]|nr:hypothetical protein HZ326_5300 [Fusarium oxysporum f. sp. albedinis]